MNKRVYIYGVCVILVLVCLIVSSVKDTDKKIDTQSDTNNDDDDKILPYTFTDALGNDVTVESLDSVVILYGSFAECWINGGGMVTGTTEDAVEERNLELGENVKIVGSVKEPSLEEVLMLEPTLVIMSADIEKQKNFKNSFERMEIPYAYMQIDVFEEYLEFLKIATELNERSDLYYENGVKVKEKIDSILAKVPYESDKKILLLRAYSTGVKAKTDDNFTGIMLKELGTENIADKYPSLLEELSIEEIMEEDPEYIFVTTMGDEEKALESLMDGIGSNPAWSSLSAVKNDKFIVLPKDMFHYKPNARWADSYEYLAKILYPKIFK